MAKVELEDIDKIKKLYFVGIKGVGMAGLAVIAKEAGFEVRGSDVSEEFITDTVLEKHNIKIDEGFDLGSISEFIGENAQEVLVVTSAAHEGLNNPQCIKAKDLGVQVLTHGQAVGFFMEGQLFKRNFKGISVLGCHGKTTITAMLAFSLSDAGIDPSWAVGTSQIFPAGDAGHFGKGDYFIAEADEFISDVRKDKTVKFLYQSPEIAIINNIDFDHPDVYENLQDVKDTFFKFIFENIKENGFLIINGDDENLQELKTQNGSSASGAKVKISNKKIKVISYGENDENDYRIKNFKEVGWGSEFEVFSSEENFETFRLSVPGSHNAKNSLAVIALMRELGIELSIIKKAIAKFKGTKRRQEELGQTKNGAEVIDDYAHHPDEIIKTIEAVKKAYPSKKIVCLFQPHTLGRTIALEKEFAKAFNGAEEVIFLPIFTSKREEETNYDHLYDHIKKSMQESGLKVYFPKDMRTSKEKLDPPYFYKKNREEVVKYITDRFDSKEYIILTLGAGDLYRIGYDMID